MNTIPKIRAASLNPPRGIRLLFYFNLDSNNQKEAWMKRIGSCALIGFLFCHITLAMARADSDQKYRVSLRYAFTPGNLVFEKYSSVIVDARYFISPRFDIGLGYEHSQDHVIEMTNDIETLAPDGEIDGTARSRIFCLFSAFHPIGRQRVLDPYVGAAVKYYHVEADDERSADYDLEIDTPGAFGLALKGGIHWYFIESWALTIDGDVGQVYNNYSVKDRQSGISDDLTSPHYNGNISIGLSVGF
jgi:outer membrane protein W